MQNLQGNGIKTASNEKGKMELTPFYNDEPLTTTVVQIRINPEDRKRSRALLAGTADIVVVNDESSFTLAKHALGQLKNMLNEIEQAKKSIKTPFDSVISAIGETAREIWEPVMLEHRRIQELLNTHVAALEAKRKEEERQHREEMRRIQQEHDRKIREAREAQEKAERDAREALDEVARQKAQNEARQQLLLAAQEQLAKEIAVEVSNEFENTKRGLVSGGRVDHNWEFELLDIKEVARQNAFRLVRWEVDHRACQDACKAQLEIDPDGEPTLPGIKVTRKINVSVRART